MQALVKHGDGPEQIGLRDIEEPVCTRDKIKIEVKACGICGTDIHIMQGHYPWEPYIPLGHEYSGVVVEVGDDIKDFKVGDRVTGCGQGGFAKYLVTDMQNGHYHFRVPDKLSFAESALFEPLAASTRAVMERSGIKPSDVVLVTGPGSIGLGAMQVAKYAGAVVIVLVASVDEPRLALARHLGADYVVRYEDGDFEQLVWEITDNRGVDAVLECSGAESAFYMALRVIRYGGRLTQIGLFGKPISLNMDGLIRGEVQLATSLGHVRESWERAIALVTEGKVNLKDMISHEFPLSEWQKGFSACRNKEGLKVLLRPDE